jgi:homocysteine S-methyltransferase
MTQVFFEWSCWERFIDRLGGRSPIPVLAAVWPLTSLALAVRLHHEVPGIIVPPDVLERLDKAGPNARREGFALARELLQEARHRVQGVYVIAPFKRPRAALELFDPA